MLLRYIPAVCAGIVHEYKSREQGCFSAERVALALCLLMDPPAARNRKTPPC